MRRVTKKKMLVGARWLEELRASVQPGGTLFFSVPLLFPRSVLALCSTR